LHFLLAFLIHQLAFFHRLLLNLVFVLILMHHFQLKLHLKHLHCLLNVKKISSTKFESGGTSGGGGGGTSASGGGSGTNATQGNIITPNFNIVGNNGTNQLAQLKQAPIQAYVVSGEMSTQQSLDRNRLRNATL